MATADESSKSKVYRGNNFSVCRTVFGVFQFHKIDCKCKKKVTWPHHDREWWISASSWEEAVEKARKDQFIEDFRIMSCTMAVTGCAVCGNKARGVVQCFESKQWLCADCGTKSLISCLRRRTHRLLPQFAKSHELWCKKTYSIDP